MIKAMILSILKIGLVFVIVSCAHRGENKFSHNEYPNETVGSYMPFAGRMDREKVRAPIRASFNELKKCYDDGLKESANLNGKLVVHFEVRGDKAANSKVLSKSDSMSDKFTGCILSVINSLTFPKPIDHEFYEVTYPFIFGNSNNVGP